MKGSWLVEFIPPDDSAYPPLPQATKVNEVGLSTGREFDSGPGAAAVRAGRQSSARLGMACIVIVFAVVAWFGTRHGIGFSWRECDTQAIARNFVIDGFDPLRPRVDWRGDSDGAVECEFPAYQLLIGAALVMFGDVEWPGRALALFAMVGAMVALYRLLEVRAGAAGALAGSLVFACSGSACMLSTRVMPDSLSLAFAIASMVPFVRFLQTGSGLALVLAAAALAMSGLQKPLALQIGLLQFGWVLVMAPQRLRDRRLWVAFSCVLGVVGAWLEHGRRVHAETGLTFGVISGGDSKFPDLEHLLSGGTWLGLGGACLQYGCSIFGALAFGWLLIRRRLDRRDVVWILAILVGLVVSLRYSCSVGLGPHYHMFAAALGAWLVARAWPERASKWAWLMLLAATAGHAAWRMKAERGMRNVVAQHPLHAVAAEIRRGSEPHQLLVVRSWKTRQDPEWQRPQNIEDPSLFYQSHRRGWVLAKDEFEVSRLEDLRRRGAHLIADLGRGPMPVATQQWLAQNTDLLLEHPRGQLYRVKPSR